MKLIETDKAVLVEDIDKAYPYCNQCGEDWNLAYLEQYACGEHYQCMECGHEVCHTHRNDEIDEYLPPALR